MISLIFMMLPISGITQRHEHVIAFEKSVPEGLGKPIRLPDPGYSPEFPPQDVADFSSKQRVWVISADSVYRKIFWQYRFTMDSVKLYAPDTVSWHHQWLLAHLRDSIPDIDFKKQELVVYSACGQCLAYCNHAQEDYCHRNACNFMYKWFLRNRQPDMVKAESGRN